MAGFGRKSEGTLGAHFMPCAGPPLMKVGGVTIDWTVVTAASSNTTLTSGRVISSGKKYLAAGAVLAMITANHKYGPYKSGASDGRQTLTQGNCAILLSDVMEDDENSDHPPVAEGGAMYYDRIAGITSAQGETNPSTSTLRAAFPLVQWVNTAG